MCVAFGFVPAAEAEIKSRMSGESICAVWPVVRLEKRSTSLSKRSRICWGVDLFIANQRSLFQFRSRRRQDGEGGERCSLPPSPPPTPPPPFFVWRGGG